jgi:hypothetical protein
MPSNPQVADGKAVDVAAWRAELKAGLVQIESIAMRDLRAHVFSNAVIISMDAESKATYKGKPVSEKSRGIDFFVKRHRPRYVVNSRMTTIKHQAAANAPLFQSERGGRPCVDPPEAAR